MISNAIINAKKSSAASSGDPYYSAVSLLLPMDGADGSTTFTDASSSALAVTPTGNTQISTSQSKFGGASGYFDSTTGSISFPSTAFTLGTGDFTIECWIYPLSWGTSPNQPVIVGSGNNGAVFYLSNTGKLWIGQYGVSNYANSTASVPLNTWTHVAVSRSGTSVKLFINGVIDGTGSSSATLNGVATPKIGVDPSNSAQKFNGYIDDFRISRFARYTSTFTPPTQAHPTYASSTPADPYYGQTSLLLHMDGANGSTSFVDSGPNALAVTAAGDAKISTAQSKFGGASGAFDGAGDYLAFPSSTPFNFGTGDFTIEAWIYPLSLSTPRFQAIFSGSNTELSFNCNNQNLEVASFLQAGIAITYGNKLANGTWSHVAVSRSGTSLKLFINGNLEASATNSKSVTYAASPRVGSSSYSGNNAYFNGHIVDLRITKYARYTANFTPPSQAFPNS